VRHLTRLKNSQHTAKISFVAENVSKDITFNDSKYYATCKFGRCGRIMQISRRYQLLGKETHYF